MGIRDTGFGLNYNQGFRGREGVAFMPQSIAGSANSAWDALGAQRQRDFQGGQADQQRGLERDLAGANLAQQRYATDTAAQTARQGNRLQYQAAIYPEQGKMNRFNQVFPLFSDALGKFGSGGMLQGGYGRAGATGTQPNISAAPVFSPQQIQQQVNAARSGNDQSAAGAQQRMQHRWHHQLAGPVFGTSAPPAPALRQNLYAQNLATNPGNERDIRSGAAQTNAGQVFEAQKARQQQYANRQQEEIERGKTYTG